MTNKVVNLTGRGFGRTEIGPIYSDNKIGGPGDGGGMDIEIERRLSTIEATLPHLATKADISDIRGDIAKAESTTIQWFIGTSLGVVGALAAILAFMK